MSRQHSEIVVWCVCIYTYIIFFFLNNMGNGLQVNQIQQGWAPQQRAQPNKLWCGI
jgi:hypothetical protein